MRCDGVLQLEHIRLPGPDEEKVLEHFRHDRLVCILGFPETTFGSGLERRAGTR